MSGEEGYDDVTGEVMETTVVTPSALALLARAELDVSITTAKAYPRSVKTFLKDASDMAALNDDIAADCVYALPRGKKTIEGPSARLAEIVASAWGNCRAGARVIDEGEQFVTAQGVFHDLERNVSISYEVKRRITDSHGRRYNADMISVTANAACSIALRNAVFKGVPKAYWATAYRAARQVIAGDAQTLAARRAKAIEHFTKIGVKLEWLLAALDVKGVEDISSDHLVTLSGVKTAIRDGETSIDAAFPDPSKKPSEETPGANAPGLAGLKAQVGADKDAAAVGVASDDVVSPAPPPAPPVNGSGDNSPTVQVTPSPFPEGPMPEKDAWLTARKKVESDRLAHEMVGKSLAQVMAALTDRMVELSGEYDQEVARRAQVAMPL